MSLQRPSNSVWLCIPSARADGGLIRKWRDAGYQLAIWRDPGAPVVDAHITIEAQYPGYAAACNALIRKAFEADFECNWVVCAGDDTEPDPIWAPESIAKQCEGRFTDVNFHCVTGLKWTDNRLLMTKEQASTFGVMQPTGDRYAAGSIDRIAGSPWIGRSFCMMTYNGAGPYDPAYRHMFVDEVLFGVAHKLGVYWPRPDLIHLHHHFMRQSLDLNSPAILNPVPKHLFEANSQRHWDTFKGIFLRQKAEGFREALVLAPPPGPAAAREVLCPDCCRIAPLGTIRAHMAKHHQVHELGAELDAETRTPDDHDRIDMPPLWEDEPKGTQ